MAGFGWPPRAFEANSVGQHFKQFEAETLQAILGMDDNSKFLPVIINISAMETPNSATDRHFLDSLIIWLGERKVRAIGIDVDFSALDNGQQVTSGDWGYFRDWSTLAKTNDFKLYLGVHRRAMDSPANWLGREEFKELAVGIARPVDDPGHSFAWLVPPRRERERLIATDQGIMQWDPKTKTYSMKSGDALEKEAGQATFRNPEGFWYAFYKDTFIPITRNGKPFQADQTMWRQDAPPESRTSTPFSHG